MKSTNAITTLATSLLVFAIAISTSMMTIAQNADNPNSRIGASQQQDSKDEQTAERDANDQQSRDTADSVAADTDCIDLDPGATANASTEDNRQQNAQRSPETIAQIQRERDDCLDLIRNANGNNENAQGDRSGNAQPNTADRKD